VTKTAAALLVLAAAAAAGILYLVVRFTTAPRGAPAPGPVVRARTAAPLKLPPTTAAPPPPELQRVTLFFVSADDGLLRPEERDIARPVDAVSFARELLAEEILGPRTPGLLPALPGGTALRNVFVPGDGRVVADVQIDPAWARGAGSSEELAAVGAIVDTLLQNIAQTDAVKILVNGSEVETLAGHVDLTRPLPVMRDVLGAVPAPAPPSGTAPPPAPPATGGPA
jgi:hypothetical protein